MGTATPSEPPLAGFRAARGAGLTAVAVAAAGLLTATGGLAQPVMVPPIADAPAPASTLVGRRDMAFRIARGGSGDAAATVLAYQSPTGEGLPVALLRARRTAGASTVSVHLLPVPPSIDHAALVEGTAVEHVYGLALRQDPEAAFCLSRAQDECDAAKERLSQPALLNALVAARAEAMDRLDATERGAAWQVVTTEGVNAASSVAGVVRVRVSVDGRPLSGASIFFNRPPHSSCAAKVGPDGIASCRLVDQHGDGDAHEEAAARVVATFPGEVGARRVLVPMTFLLPPSP